MPTLVSTKSRFSLNYASAKKPLDLDRTYINSLEQMQKETKVCPSIRMSKIYPV